MCECVCVCVCVCVCDPLSAGEKFLETTAHLLTVKHKASSLLVSGACTPVAVELGELEGKVPHVTLEWDEGEGTDKACLEAILQHTCPRGQYLLELVVCAHKA